MFCHFYFARDHNRKQLNRIAFEISVELLGLLNWSCKPEGLRHSLTAFRNVSGGEVVKYLQDVLDALFNILMQNSDSDLYDDLVFKCIVRRFN